MGRYRKDGQFWSIEREGLSLVVDDTVETFAEPAALSARERILINQKLRAGWKLVPVVEEIAAVVPFVFGSRNNELEEAIFENPADPAAWQIYGDWLLDKHDARGEYIARYRQLEASPHDGVAQARLREFHERHRAYLDNGLSSARLGAGFPTWFRPTQLDQLDHALLDAGRFLREIDLHFKEFADLCEAMRRLAAHPPRTLRQLVVGGYVLVDDTLESLAVLDPVLPQLETLELRLDVRTASLARASRLRSLGIAVLDPMELLRTPLPALESLSLRTTVGVAEVNALAAAPFSEQLVELHLPRLADGAVAALVAARDSDRLSSVMTLEVGISYANSDRNVLARVFPNVR